MKVISKFNGRCMAVGQCIVTIARLELKARRFALSAVFATVWLLMLLILAARDGYGLFESAHEQYSELFKLPEPVVLDRALPELRVGALKVDPNFGSYLSALLNKRDWFSVRLPAFGNRAVEPESIVALENIRVFNAHGTQLCILDKRLEPIPRPYPFGLGADLALSQQFVRYPAREINGHHFDVFWRTMYSPACRYEEPAWVIADVIRKQAVGESEILWLELADSERVIRAGKSSVISRPGALPSEWWIETFNLGEQSLHFSPEEYPQHHGWHYFKWPKSYASQWDQIIRSKRLMLTDIYQIQFDETPPARLPIRHIRSQEHRLADVRFVTDEKLRDDPSIPSTWRIPLRHTALDIPLNLPEQEPAQEYHELFLPISLSAICQLHVVRSDLPDLHWQAIDRLPIDEYSNYAQLPERHLDRVRWELQSRDGVQRFFHDIRVESELRCPAVMNWRSVPYEASDRPWLVAASALPQALAQRDRPARELFGRVRFLDASGEALMPVARSVGLPDPDVAAFLFPGEVFKFHGDVARIEQLVVVDATPRSQRWVYSFMQLEAN